MAAAGGWVALPRGTTFLGSPPRGCPHAAGLLRDQGHQAGQEGQAASCCHGDTRPSLPLPPQHAGCPGTGGTVDRGGERGGGLVSRASPGGAGGQHRLKSLL